MKEEDETNKKIEDEDDSEDDDYMPSDEEDKDTEGSADEANLDDLVNNEEVNEESNSISKQLSEAEKKRRADELWADLCSSTSNKSIKKTTDSNTMVSSTSNSISSSINKSIKNNSVPSISNKIKLTKEYEFAGEKIKVEQEVDCNKIDSTDTNSVNSSSNSSMNSLKRGLGLNNLVANLGKKQKLTTLSKTKLDWDMFKKDEGIEDDLKNHTKNKNSYVERQAFLQRTDLKQFELEKSVREKTRNSRN